MSVSCGVECVFILGCARWMWKRCTYIGSYDSATWPSATFDEFEPIPRVCRLILAVYEPDLLHPHYEPSVHRLNLVKESDFKLLLDNRLRMQMFDGGYVHGLLKSAIWLLKGESETLKRLWVKSGSDYRMVFAGHSLGYGVVAYVQGRF